MKNFKLRYHPYLLVLIKYELLIKIIFLLNLTIYLDLIVWSGAEHVKIFEKIFILHFETADVMIFYRF